jgi:hypothetical protein
MNKDNVVKWAHEAGCEVYEGRDIAPALVRFAALILQSKRSLTDAEIGAIWFEAKIPGLTETNARLLIRATERKIREL